jgi:hypothetical protein
MQGVREVRISDRGEGGYEGEDRRKAYESEVITTKAAEWRKWRYVTVVYT